MTEVTDGQAPVAEATPIVETMDALPVETQGAEATAADHDDGADDTAQPDGERKPNRGVQKRLDELTRQRHEAERRAQWLEQQLSEVTARLPRQEVAQAPALEAPLTLEAFGWDESAYYAAVEQRAQQTAEKAVEGALQRREREALEAAQRQTFESRLNDARGKYADFDTVVFSPNVPITPSMAEAIQALPDGADIAYQLGRNPSEAARISSLPKVLQAVEIGRLSARAAAPTQSRAAPPAPPQTISGTVAGAPTVDEARMSDAEWAASRKIR